MYISEFSFFLVVFLKKKLIIGISPKIGILLSIFCWIDFFKPPNKIVTPFLNLNFVVSPLQTLYTPSELYVQEFISFKFKTFEPKTFELKSFKTTILRRGVIGVSKIGYI